MQPTTVPSRSEPKLPSAAPLVAAALWLAAGGAGRLRAENADGDWEGPYALFSVVLLIAAAATTVMIVIYTSKEGARSGARNAAVALAIVGTVSTVAAWAFPLWAVLLAAGWAALAATGSPSGRDAAWVGGALLAGLAVAVVAVNAKLGAPGRHSDYSDAQSWGVTTACVLAAVGLARLGLGISRTSDGAQSAKPTR